MITRTLESFKVCSRSYKNLCASTEPPVEFREVIEKIPLVEELLILIRQRYEADDVGEVPERAFFSLLETYMAKAATLRSIYESVEAGARSSAEGSVKDAYRNSLRSMEKPERVETIMGTLLYYSKAIAANRLFEMHVYERAPPLQEAMDALSSLDSCIADSELQGSGSDSKVENT